MLQQNISNIQQKQVLTIKFLLLCCLSEFKVVKSSINGRSVNLLVDLIIQNFKNFGLFIHFFRVFLYLAKRPHFAYFKLSVSQFFDAHIVSYLKYLKKNNRIKRHCKKKSSYIIELISNSTSILAIGIINLDTYVCIYVKMYTEIYQIFRCELNCTLNNNYTAIILITIQQQ